MLTQHEAADGHVSDTVTLLAKKKMRTTRAYVGLWQIQSAP